jgi:hypothetical protein
MTTPSTPAPSANFHHVRGRYREGFMSDGHTPRETVDLRLQDQLSAAKAVRDTARGAERGVGGAGGPPHDPGMESRMAALADIKEVRTALGGIKVVIARIDERTGFLATGSNLAVLKSDGMLALQSKAGRGTVWAAALSVAGLVVAAALGAVDMPYLATLLRRAG